MHLQTHVLTGWCAGNLISLSPRERLFAMLAASLPDLDGLGLVISQRLYADYHHILGHNLLFGGISCAVLALFSPHRLKAFLAYAALFLTHLVMDYFGSGPGWGLSLFYPFSDYQVENLYAWPFYSWQNLSAAAIVYVGSFLVIIFRRRTPLEYLMPDLDRQLVAVVTEKRRWGNGQGGTIRCSDTRIKK